MNSEWKLWRAQLAAILRLELKKNLFARRAWWIYLLAIGPPLLTFAHSFVVMKRGRTTCSIGEDSMIYAGIFQFYYLRLCIFFGCVGVFMNLFRGESLEKTLHYYFLSPVRREILLAGKYLTGVIVAVTVFGSSVALAYLGIFLHFGEAHRDYAQLGSYVGVAALASIGYGAVFVLAGLLYRNPMIPAAVVWVWEGLNNFLPDFLQKISVIFYVRSLCPVEVPVSGPLALIAVLAEPAPAWLAIPGLLLVSLLLLFYAAARSRDLEVSYTD